MDCELNFKEERKNDLKWKLKGTPAICVEIS